MRLWSTKSYFTVGRTVNIFGAPSHSFAPRLNRYKMRRNYNNCCCGADHGRAGGRCDRRLSHLFLAPHLILRSPSLDEWWIFKCHFRIFRDPARQARQMRQMRMLTKKPTMYGKDDSLVQLLIVNFFPVSFTEIWKLCFYRFQLEWIMCINKKITQINIKFCFICQLTLIIIIETGR